MKKFLLLSFFLLAGCWVNKTVDTAQNDVQKINTTTETGDVLSQTWTTETPLQTWQNLSEEDKKIIKKLNLGESYNKEINISDLISYSSTWWDVINDEDKSQSSCKEIVPIIYTFRNKFDSKAALDNQVFVYPAYENIRDNKTIGDDCIDIIKDKYQRYENFLKSKREITKVDDNFKAKFGWFTGQILKQNWKDIWIEFYNWNFINPCYNSNFEYKIYFIDYLNRLIEIRYYSYIQNYSDKFWENYIPTHKNINKNDFCDMYKEKDMSLVNKINNDYGFFILENLSKYNPTDYKNIQSIKKWVLDYLSFEK